MYRKTFSRSVSAPPSYTCIPLLRCKAVKLPIWQTSGCALIFEHFLDDKKGFACNLEFVTLHGLAWRADGHEIKASQESGFTTVGVEPPIHYRFIDAFIAAVGRLFKGRRSTFH
jgi:hypothetical protein